MAKTHNNGGLGRYDGVRNSKSPIGSRPVSRVARSTPREPTAGNRARPAAKYTPMPAPKTKATTGRGKPHGGR